VSEEKKKTKEKKSKKKMFEMLLVEGNLLLSTNKPIEGKLTGNNPILGQSFLSIVQKPNHLSSRPFFTLVHLNWGSFHLFHTYSSLLGIQFSLYDDAPSSNLDMFFGLTNRTFILTSLRLPNTPKFGQSYFACIPCIKFSLSEVNANDNISEIVQSQLPLNIFNFLSYIFHAPLDLSACIKILF